MLRRELELLLQSLKMYIGVMPPDAVINMVAQIVAIGQAMAVDDALERLRQEPEVTKDTIINLQKETYDHATNLLRARQSSPVPSGAEADASQS